MYDKGTQYVQFMPVNGCLDPGPLYGPAEEVSVQMVGFYGPDGVTLIYSPAFRIGNRTFVFREKQWTLYSRQDEKDTYTPVPGNEGENGYQRFRVVSLKTVVDDAEEQAKRQAQYAKLRKAVKRK
jgi:hypothetical protein